MIKLAKILALCAAASAVTGRSAAQPAPPTDDRELVVVDGRILDDAPRRLNPVSETLYTRMRQSNGQIVVLRLGPQAAAHGPRLELGTTVSARGWRRTSGVTELLDVAELAPAFAGSQRIPGDAATQSTRPPAVIAGYLVKVVRPLDPGGDLLVRVLEPAGRTFTVNLGRATEWPSHLELLPGIVLAVRGTRQDDSVVIVADQLALRPSKPTAGPPVVLVR